MSWISKGIKKIGKAVSKVAGNKVVRTIFPTFSLANSSTGQKIGLGIAGGLGLSSLFGSTAGQVYDSAVGPTTSGSPMEANTINSGFLGGLANLAKGLFTGGADGSSFLGGLVNSGLGLLGSQYTADKQLQRDLQLQDQAFAKNVAMWNAQNAYNTPQAQMERYKQAGLNPNLIYGNGVSSAGNASSAPSYEAPKYKGIDLQSIMMFQQLENMNAQQQLLANQTELARIQATGASLDNEVKAVNAGYATDMADANLAIKHAEARNINASADSTEHADTSSIWTSGFWRKAVPGWLSTGKDLAVRGYKAWMNNNRYENWFKN